MQQLQSGRTQAGVAAEKRLFPSAKVRAQAVHEVTVAPAYFTGFKEITASLRNNTSKEVDGIKLTYNCMNNFGDEVASGDFPDQNTRIGPNGAGSSTHSNVFSESCVKATVKVAGVHFSDGSAW